MKITLQNYKNLLKKGISLFQISHEPQFAAAKQVVLISQMIGFAF